MTAISDGNLFQDKTINQHYISQAEQRLNSLNPSASKRSQKIYEFLVCDRELPELSLVDAAGRRIKNSLSFDDLFTFDAEQDAVLRSNLERLFGVYEQDVATNSQLLLERLQPGHHEKIEGEVVDLFAAKFLNMLRNPYSVTKVLNTVGMVANYSPTDPQLLLAFKRVLLGSRPRQKDICEKFGLSPEMYERWLKVLFLLLSKQDDEPLSLFESLIKRTFESNAVLVHVYEYTTAEPHQVCLLSDRGFNEPLRLNSTFAFEANLCSRAFIRFFFCDPGTYAPNGSRPELVDRARGRVIVSRFENDLSALAQYNQLTAFQCASRVFAASPSPMLAAR